MSEELDTLGAEAHEAITKLQSQLAEAREDVQFLGEQLYVMEHFQDRERINLVQKKHGIVAPWNRASKGHTPGDTGGTA